MKTLGFNYKLTEMQCALGFSQFKKIKKFILFRKKILKYIQKFGQKFFNLQEIQSDYESAYHLMIVKTKQKFSQKSKLKFFSFLKRNKVIFNVQYLPINMHRFYIQNQRFFYKKIY